MTSTSPFFLKRLRLLVHVGWGFTAESFIYTVAESFICTSVPLSPETAREMWAGWRHRNWLNKNNSLFSAGNMPGSELGAFHTSIFLEWLLCKASIIISGYRWAKWDFARWNLSSKVIQLLSSTARISMADWKSIIFETHKLNVLIDFSFVGGLLWYFLLTSEVWKWNRFLWEKMSSLVQRAMKQRLIAWML